jgi:uncharacterized protein (DUF2141 family)
MKYFLLAGFVSACSLAAQSAPGVASIEGHVFNSLTGAPVRKANVVLTSPASEIHLVSNTDPEGKFEFIGLPPGTYRVSASRSGFVERPTRRAIQLGPNSQITDAEIRLPPQSAISGHILDEDGEPVDRARIAVFKQTYRNGSRQWDRLGPNSETNDTGEYRFTNLTPGRYLLQAYNTRPQNDNRYGEPPKMFYVPVYYPNVLSQEQALPVALGVGVEVRGIDIRLLKLSRPPSVSIRGKVTGLPADSAAVVSVSLSPADASTFGNFGALVKSPDYAFELSAPPGQYTILANVYSGGQEAFGKAVVTVTGDVDGVVLAMNPAPNVTVRISLAESGAKVNLKDVRMTVSVLSSFIATGEFELRADEAGKFSSFPMPVRRPGHFAIVNVRSIPDGYFVREFNLNGQEISPDDFEIQSSADLEMVLSSTAAKIAGSVADADGKPIPDSKVTLIPTEGKSRSAKQSVADDGSFQFTNLRPGKYKLFAWEEVDDDLWQDPEFRKNYESLATEITVAPSETQNAQLRVIAADAMK